MISITYLENYLNTYGWSFEKQEDNIILTGFLSESSNEKFLLVIQLSPPWLRFSIPFYLPLSNSSDWNDLAKQLLKINYLSRQVYFGISEEEGIVLSTDIFVEYGLTYEIFETAVDSLTYVAESSFLPLINFMNEASIKKSQNSLS